ncbi:hypothetical protein FRC05_000884 [Tulasnella sp. 425]|nr:hypothetical protein FRC05_000884 [Tulasnella sp. 425]
MGKKATNAVPAPRNAPAPAPAATVNDTDWPSISQKDYLEVDVFEPDQILLIHNFLDPAECKAFCSFLEKLPLVVTPAAKRGEADRVNDRISIPSPSFAESLWTALGPHVGNIPSFQSHLSPPARASAFNSNIRLYRYSEGQYFGAHYDDSIRDPKAGMWSEWTLLVYLTGEEDGVEGGQDLFGRSGTDCILQTTYKKDNG